MQAVLGSTAGSDSGSAYGSATVTVTLGHDLTLLDLTFYAVQAATYTLRVDGVDVATVVAPGGAEATFTGVNLLLTAGSHTVSLVPSTSARVRYASGSTQSLGMAVTVGHWIEFTTAYTLPWVYSVDWDVTFAPPGQITEPDAESPGQILTEVLTRRERIPAYQATGVTGSGGDDVELTTGQIWPR